MILFFDPIRVNSAVVAFAIVYGVMAHGKENCVAKDGPDQPIKYQIGSQHLLWDLHGSLICARRYLGT